MGPIWGPLDMNQRKNFRTLFNFKFYFSSVRNEQHGLEAAARDAPHGLRHGSARHAQVLHDGLQPPPPPAAAAAATATATTPPAEDESKGSFFIL